MTGANFANLNAVIIVEEVAPLVFFFIKFLLLVLTKPRLPPYIQMAAK